MQGTVLKDYSGATLETATVEVGKRVTIKVPPCNGSALGGRRCYAIWGPLSPPGHVQSPRETTQEWEMNDDLGDSHPKSLQQGGSLPANSIETRTAGRIFVEAGKVVSYQIYLTDTLNSVTLELYDANDVLVHDDSGLLIVSGTYLPRLTGWYIHKCINIKIYF